jgi:hypothetical protein
MRQDVEWGCEGEENEVISMAEGARFENPEAIETIEPHRSFYNQLEKNEKR